MAPDPTGGELGALSARLYPGRTLSPAEALQLQDLRRARRQYVASILGDKSVPTEEINRRVGMYAQGSTAPDMLAERRLKHGMPAMASAAEAAELAKIRAARQRAAASATGPVRVAPGAGNQVGVVDDLLNR